MLMMCWFYGVPFIKGLFFTSSLLLLLFSVFALKRGVRQSRSTLRDVAFFLMFIALLKLFIVDAYILREYLLCEVGVFVSFCTSCVLSPINATTPTAIKLNTIIKFFFIIFPPCFHYIDSNKFI